ncbi:XrtA/PEP-CTERM system TPR-repeat protein PrsT [Vibrio alfacsensis]|uniref:XrtA/PEP-CTERM system TPR-repeat protein PrsT n=1 Tax=Vibrio alfacsensis TaxID=1074311 RepID=UPI001BEE42DF|nr:XrtA/PEP-CTERM system TPR-repeat protein PrsT [Vibrio alfacsensis]BCN27281.1 lipoprotein [Vibrio alfacsensis]
MSYGKEVGTNRTALIGLALAALLYSQGSIANNKYIDSAQEYLNKNETNAAMIELKNAIQQSPEDGLARFMLGKIYLQQGNFSNAEKELSRAIKYGYSPDDSVPLLARSLLSQNKLEETVLLLEEFDLSDSLASSELFAIAAMAEIRLNNVEKTKALLEQAGTETHYAKLAHATYLSATNERDEAQKSIDALLKLDNSNSDTWILNGHLAMTRNDFDIAYESYKKASELSPMAIQYQFFMANALVHDKRLAEASPIVDELLKINSQGSYINELRAIILFADKNYADAKIHADRALNNGSKSLRAATISGVSAFQLGQFEQAHRILKKVSPRLPNNHIVNRLYHVTQLKLGYLDEAIESLNSYDIQTKEDSAFISRASMELAKIGRNDMALELAQKASENDSSQAEATLGLIKLANNDLTGIDDLQSALEDNIALPGAKRALVNYYLLRKELDEADAVANKWLKENPSDIDGLIVKGIVSKEKGQLEQAKSYYNQVQELAPHNTQALVELAGIESLMNRPDAALSLLLSAKEQSPNDHNVSKKLIEYSQELNRLPEAIALIDKQLKSDPFNRHLKIQKAHALELSGGKEAAIDILESLPNSDKDAAVWKLLGNLYYSEGDLSQAKRNYEQWLDLAKYNPAAYIGNIQLAKHSGDFNEGLKLVNRAIEIFPNDFRFQYLKAELLYRKGELNAAQRELAKLPQGIQETANFLRLQGIIYIAKEDYPAAVNVHKARYDLKPTIITARELAHAYALNGQENEAINFLIQLMNEYGESVWPLKLKLAELYIDSQPDKAIEEYKTILEKQPSNPLALNNLAWLYLDKEQPSKACEFAKKAYEIANQSVEIADTYGYCLFKSGDTQKALELLELAYTSKQYSPEIALHFAEVLISDKQVKQATDVLSNIVTKDPSLVATKNELEEQAKRIAQ